MKYLLTGEETRRLRFRLLHENDFENWLPLFRTQEAEKFLGLASIPTPEERCKKWFEIVLNRYKKDLGGMNVLINKETGQLVGQCGLLIQEVDNQRELEIGYSILPAFWGHGYATEAAIKCKGYAFEHKYSDSLISIIHVNNIRSEKVAMKNGMLFEKKTIFKEMPVNIFRVIMNELPGQ
jgi:[ribosomal protein S5]-alanine N-acetyltransferase